MIAILSTLLTHSRLKTFRQCKRLHFFKYLQGYRPVEDAEELAFGSLFHLGLEQWWLGVKNGAPVDLWLTVALSAVRGVKDVDPFHLALCEVMLAGYHARWCDAAADFEVLGVENQFTIALRNPATGASSPAWKLAGKLDVKARRRSDGTVGFIEHKTAGGDISLGSFYWARLRLDAQVSIYFDGASGSEQAEWCLYDVAAKPSQRPLKATPIESRKYLKKDMPDGRKAGTLYADQRENDETPAEYRARLADVITAAPDEYFVRGEVVRLEAELQEARAEIWQQAAEMREAINANRHPRNVEACGFGQRVCAFFAVCSGAESLDNPRLFTRTDNVHAELAAPPSEQSPKEVGAA